MTPAGNHNYRELMPDSQNEVRLTDSQLAALDIKPAEIIECIERAVQQAVAGQIWTAPKASLVPGDGRYMMATLAAAREPALVVVKSVMVCPNNPKLGLSAINGAILIMDGETGLLRAVLDANWITAVRTAGLSAVVAKRLANPQASRIGFIGCGVQACSHLDALSAVFPIREIRAFGRGKTNLDRLCSKARASGLNAVPCSTPRNAVQDVDLVVSSVTLDYELHPFLDANWLAPGCFAAITDLGLPWHPASLDAFATIIIDDRAQEATSERPMLDPKRISGDLTDLLTGRVQTAFDPHARSAFMFRGLAIGDLAVAMLAYERACKS